MPSVNTDVAALRKAFENSVQKTEADCSQVLHLPPQKKLYSQKSCNLFHQHRCFREAEQRSASRRRAQQRTPALRLQPEKSLAKPFGPGVLPPFPAFSKMLSLPAAQARRRGEAGRQNLGGAGGIISDIAEMVLPQLPVCARHSVPTQGLHDGGDV